MFITCHWSATSPVRIRDYHIEYALVRPLAPAVAQSVAAAKTAAQVDWAALASGFDIYKNVDFSTSTTYGTYLLNHDPRDGSPNIEIGALCMGGESVGITGSWGTWPFTFAHAWMAAGIVARVCTLKNLDAGESFAVPSGATVLQNGPIFAVSTHAERAYQTQDQGADQIPARGYFAYSGDPDCRWDLAALDPSTNSQLSTFAGALASAQAAAAWIRAQAHAIKAAGINDFWALDKAPT